MSPEAEAAIAHLEKQDANQLRYPNISIKDIKRLFDAGGSEAVLEVLEKKAAGN